MHPVLHFNSRLFDLATERENPINPIPGVSLLEWLRANLPPPLDLSEPDAEDWGWYSHLDFAGRTYLVGACAHEDASGAGNHEWVLQVDKLRSWREKLLGRETMAADDPCFAMLHARILKEPAFTDVSIE